MVKKKSHAMKKQAKQKKHHVNQNINTLHSESATIKIIAGQWRSRYLKSPVITGLRPTSSRLRETLFNWLQQNIEGAYCLDAFSGTGALGFEALSRGAKQVDFLEKNTTVCDSLTANANLLSCNNCKIIQTDTLTFLQKPAQQHYDIIFMDPPFNQNILTPCCALLNQNNYLKPCAYVYIEMEQELANSFSAPTNWRNLKHKKAGQVITKLFQN